MGHSSIICSSSGIVGALMYSNHHRVVLRASMSTRCAMMDAEERWCDMTATLNDDTRASVRARMESIPEALSPELVERMRDDRRGDGRIRIVRATEMRCAVRSALVISPASGDLPMCAMSRRSSIRQLITDMQVRPRSSASGLMMISPAAACTCSSLLASRAISALHSGSTAISSKPSGSATIWDTRRLDMRANGA